MENLNVFIPTKKIRARIIKEYYGSERVVCLSCGNAVKALEEAGVNVISVSPVSRLNASAYLPPKEIQRCFNAPDVSSGCLPMHLIRKIGSEYYAIIQKAIPAGVQSQKTYLIPCGSGETIMALAHFIPMSRIIGYYSPAHAAIDFSYYTPLYDFILNNVALININEPAGLEYFNKMMKSKKRIAILTAEAVCVKRKD